LHRRVAPRILDGRGGNEFVAKRERPIRVVSQDDAENILGVKPLIAAIQT